MSPSRQCWCSCTSNVTATFIFSINLLFTAGRTIEPDWLPVLVYHSRHFLHPSCARWQFSDLITTQLASRHQRSYSRGTWWTPWRWGGPRACPPPCTSPWWPSVCDRRSTRWPCWACESCWVCPTQSMLRVTFACNQEDKTHCKWW